MATPTKLETRGNRLRERLEKLADSQDEKIAAKATSDLLTMHVAEVEAESREDRIAPLRDEIKELTRALKAADEALAPVTAERDSLLAEVTTLREQVTTLTPVQDQLNAMIAENADWRKAQHALLVGENQQRCWASQRAENNAKEIREQNNLLFSSGRQESLMTEIARLVKVHNIPQPDIWNLPKGINPLLLTLWGWDRIKAGYFVAFTEGYPEPTEAFKQMLFRHLKAGLPIHGTMPDPIEHLGVKLDVLRMMAARWPGVMEQAQRRVDEIEAQERGQAMFNTNRLLADQQRELAMRGYGRSEIGQPEVKQVFEPGHWDGFIPAAPERRTLEQPLEDDGPSEPWEDH